MDKQSPLVLYLIILFGFTLGFLVNSRSDSAADVPPIDARHQLTSLRGLDTLHIDYTILQSEQFTSLRVFGQLPVVPSGNGKADPFQ